MHTIFSAQQKHNFIVNIIDGSLFGFGIGFSSFTTILPLFVSSMTDSAVLIGLIPAIHNVGWQAPQLFYAQRINRMKLFKPSVLLMSTQERIPFLGFALIAFLQPSISIEIALSLFFLLLIWNGLGAGLTANTWQNMICKVIPGEYLGTFFGVQAAVSNLFASIGAVIAGFILDNQASPNSFGICFLITSGMMVFSWIALSLTHEDKRIISENPPPSQKLIPLIKNTLREDMNFTWYLIARIVWQFGLMAFGFYIIYAVNYYHMDKITAGLVTGTLMLGQVAANPMLGWLADKWGRKWILELGAISTSLSALLALLAPDISWFYAVVLFAGIANASYWTIGMAFSLDFGREEERPTYVGLANTLPSPATVIAPFLGGIIADGIGYPATFLTAVVAGILAFLLIHFQVHQRQAA
jgi:MFS family permease